MAGIVRRSAVQAQPVTGRAAKCCSHPARLFEGALAMTA
jgi:hypothetical protein